MQAYVDLADLDIFGAFLSEGDASALSSQCAHGHWKVAMETKPIYYAIWHFIFTLHVNSIKMVKSERSKAQLLFKD